MVKLITANCPNCGANVELNPHVEMAKCKYCKCTILVDGVLNIMKSNVIKDDIHEKCLQVTQKLNEILKLYVGNKNEMCLMLKDKIGLVNSGRTTAKIEMMKTANEYIEENFDAPFTYRIGDRVLDHFEYKRDGSVEVTYDSDKDEFFAIEYYGRILKYTDLNDLIRALDEIIEEVKIKFQ